MYRSLISISNVPRQLAFPVSPYDVRTPAKSFFRRCSGSRLIPGSAAASGTETVGFETYLQGMLLREPNISPTNLEQAESDREPEFELEETLTSFSSYQLSSDCRNLHDRIRSSNYDQSGEIPSSEFSSGTAGFNVTGSGDATSSGGILSAALRPTPAQTETSDNLSILTMLQQQQAVLQRVLDGQKSLEECQNKMEQSLAELQKNMEQSAQCSTADSGTDHKRNRVVTRTLSVSHIMYYYLFY